jgi:hypothetical protein
MQAEVEGNKEFKLQRHADASVKKATGDATSVKISANAEAIKVNANAEHQNNCNGVAKWCHFSKKDNSRSILFAVNAMGKEKLYNSK